MGKHQIAKGNERKKDILKFILRFTIKKQYPPTFREIGRGVGLSGPGHVHYYLHALRREGRLRFDDGYSRTIIVVDPDALMPEVLKEMQPCPISPN